MKTNGSITKNGYHHQNEQTVPMIEHCPETKQSKRRRIHCTRCRWALTICMTLFAICILVFFIGGFHTAFFGSGAPAPDMQLGGGSDDYNDYANEEYEDDNEYTDYEEDVYESPEPAFPEIVVEEEIVVVVPAILNETQLHDDNSTNSVDEEESRVEATTNGIAANDVEVVEVVEEVTAAPVAPPAKKKKPARKQRKPAQFLKPDLEHIVLSGTFPVSVDTLHDTVAGDDITYIKQWYEDHLATEYTISEWGPGTDTFAGHEVRTMVYNQLKQHLFVPKGYFVVNVKEVRYQKSKKGRSYTVDLFNQASGMMYSETFYTVARYNIRRISDSEAEFRVSYEIRWHEKPWFVSGTIESKGQEEVSAVYRDMNTDLRRMFPGSTAE